MIKKTIKQKRSWSLAIICNEIGVKIEKHINYNGYKTYKFIGENKNVKCALAIAESIGYQRSYDKYNCEVVCY